MLYMIRCIDGTFTVAFGFKSALSILRDAGADAAVFTLLGRWVAGRKVVA